MKKPRIAVIMFENNRRQHEMSAKMNDEDSMLGFTFQQDDGRRFSSPLIWIFFQIRQSDRA